MKLMCQIKILEFAVTFSTAMASNQRTADDINLLHNVEVSVLDEVTDKKFGEEDAIKGVLGIPASNLRTADETNVTYNVELSELDEVSDKEFGADDAIEGVVGNIADGRAKSSEIPRRASHQRKLSAPDKLQEWNDRKKVYCFTFNTLCLILAC
jgi:hypothetical protein